MHYMPVLRVKQSEYLALGQLHTDVADKLAPLLYQTPSGDADPMETARRRLGYLARDWERPAFYDPRLAAVHEDIQISELYDHAAQLGPYAPVVGLDGHASAAVQAAELHQRAAIRLDNPYVLLDPSTEGYLTDCLDTLSLAPEQVVLVYDVADSIDPHVVAAVHRIPYFHRWDAIVVAGGAFAPSTHPDTTSEISRTHLHNWRQTSGQSSRTIIFGDYGTLEPTYEEPVSYPPAAKLTYTEPDHWFYTRGRSIAQYGNEQIYDLAVQVTQRPHWRGGEYSWGDQWLEQRARRQGSAGNAAMWIRVALTHHITHVVREDV